MDEEERNRKRMQLMGSYIMLPFVLGVPPIVGWYLGSWLDSYFNSAPYGMFVLIILGMVAGAREFYRIVTTFKDDEM